MKRQPAGQRLAIVVFSAALIAGSVAAAGHRSGAVAVSGTAELTYSKQHAIDVPDAPGHQLLAGETKGINKNTGSTDYFAGADVLDVETADLQQGNGPHQGYYTAAKGADTMTAKWQGTVKTVMGPDKQPRTSFKGTWSYVHGAGRYKNLKGNGTYEGEFVAKDRYVVRWRGTYNP